MLRPAVDEVAKENGLACAVPLAAIDKLVVQLVEQTF